MRVALITALALMIAAPASAQRKKRDDVSRAQALVDRGDQLFDQKRYEEAITEYTAALAIVSHADLVWNIARAHQELKRHRQALMFFERYQQMEVSDADKAAAARRIAQCKNALEAAKRGRLVVTTPSARAAVTVGGIEVGRGKRVAVTVRPGRYRVRVDLDGHEPFETKAAVPPAGEALVEAVLKRVQPRAVLVVVVEGGVQGAEVAIDGGTPAPVGIPIPLPGGAHKLVVTAPRYSPVEQLIEAPAGEKTTITVRLGKARPPVEYPTWAGEFRLFGDLLDGGKLSLDKDGRGTVSVARKMALEKWRRDGCGGAAEVTWREVWAARLTGDGLVLEANAAEECTCDVWCKTHGDQKLEVIELPGREGLLGTTTVALRDELLDEGAGAHAPTDAAAVKGDWTVVTWPDGGAKRLVIGGERGVLELSRSSMVPSHKRRACPETSRWEQTLQYPVTLKSKGAALTLSFGAGLETACSCTGACDAAPPLKAVDMRLLSVPRYLVGPNLVLRRVE